MSDVDTVAECLEGFFEDVTNTAQTNIGPSASFQQRVGTGRAPGGRSTKQIYRQCVGMLSDDERAELHRLIDKMKGAI